MSEGGSFAPRAAALKNGATIRARGRNETTKTKLAFGGPPLLLKNVAAGENHWLGLRLIGKKANPDGVGARITWQAGDLKRSRLKVGGGSYLSSHDPRDVLGIGKRTKIEKVEIQWPQPSGRVETFPELPVDRYIAVVEGVGIK